MVLRTLSRIFTGAILALLCLPGAAIAGQFAWDMPANFTLSGGGSNPDHDSYGATPWSYAQALGTLVLPPTHDPSLFSALPHFSGNVRGGLAGWTGTGSALVAANPTSGTVHDGGGDAFPAGTLVMTPPSNGLVAVRWRSPLLRAATIAISGSVGAAQASACFSWSLDQDGATLHGQQGNGAGSFSTSTTVQPGGVVDLAVTRLSDAPLVSNPECGTANTALHITETETAGPTVRLDTPGNGALIAGGQPTFTGAASTAFGASPRVTVRVFSGPGTGGSPIETVTATRGSDGRFTVGPSAALADGQYTAQAEQDDLASPVDRGFSSVSTFVVHNAPPTLTLRGPGPSPVTTATPAFTGTASTAVGVSRSVTLAVFPGTRTSGTPVRRIGGAVSGGGAFSIRVSPGLPDGQYTAVATQTGPGTAVGFSPPVTVRIKVHGPALSVTAPASGASVADSRPTFAGVAGDVTGDSSRITVSVYAGRSTSGRAIGHQTATRRGALWALRWSKGLKLDVYTFAVTQSDDAHHTTRVTGTLRVVLPPPTIGPTITLSRRSGRVTISVSCVGSGGAICTGDVLALTADPMRTVSGGPYGAVRVLFAHVSILAGATARVSQALPGYVVSALRQVRSLKVRVRTMLVPTGRASATRTLIMVR